MDYLCEYLLMSQLWTKTGKVVVNSSGAPVYSSACPCPCPGGVVNACTSCGFNAGSDSPTSFSLNCTSGLPTPACTLTAAQASCTLPVYDKALYWGGQIKVNSPNTTCGLTGTQNALGLILNISVSCVSNQLTLAITRYIYQGTAYSASISSGSLPVSVNCSGKTITYNAVTYSVSGYSGSLVIPTVVLTWS